MLLLDYAIQRLSGNDFGKFYFALLAWRDGSSLYTPTVATHIVSNGTSYEFLNMNPPHFHILLWPFIGLPLNTALYLWSSANLAAGVWAGVMTCGELQRRPKATIIPALCVAALACASTGAVVFTGQYVGLMMVPLVLAWRASRRRELFVAGAWLGILIGLKPFLALFLPLWLARGERKSVYGALFTGVLSFAVGIIIFGVQAHREWVAALGSVSWPWVEMNGSVEAVLARALTPSPAFKMIAACPSVVRPIWLLSAAVICLATSRAALRSVDHLYAAATLGSLLISPLGWVYYLWLALPALLSLWRERLPRLALLGALGLTVPFFAVLLVGRVSVIATLTVGSVYTWATLALWLSTVRTRGERVVSRALGDFA